jgi:hypothetical protein
LNKNGFTWSERYTSKMAGWFIVSKLHFTSDRFEGQSIDEKQREKPNQQD